MVVDEGALDNMQQALGDLAGYSALDTFPNVQHNVCAMILATVRQWAWLALVPGMMGTGPRLGRWKSLNEMCRDMHARIMCCLQG